MTVRESRRQHRRGETTAGWLVPKHSKGGHRWDVKRRGIAIALTTAAGIFGTATHAVLADGVASASGVTGGYGYDAYGLARHADLQAHPATAGRPAYGGLRYRDAAGQFYSVAIDCVSVSGNTAVFEGVVGDASNPGWDGLFLLAKLVDNGSPGTDGDLAWGSFFAVRQPCDGSVTPPYGPFALTNGNIVVHL